MQVLENFTKIVNTVLIWFHPEKEIEPTKFYYFNISQIYYVFPKYFAKILYQLKLFGLEAKPKHSPKQISQPWS